LFLSAARLVAQPIKGSGRGTRAPRKFYIETHHFVIRGNVPVLFNCHKNFGFRELPPLTVYYQSNRDFKACWDPNFGQCASSECFIVCATDCLYVKFEDINALR